MNATVLTHAIGTWKKSILALSPILPSAGIGARSAKQNTAANHINKTYFIILPININQFFYKFSLVSSSSRNSTPLTRFTSLLISTFFLILFISPVGSGTALSRKFCVVLSDDVIAILPSLNNLCQKGSYISTSRTL